MHIYRIIYISKYTKKRHHGGLKYRDIYNTVYCHRPM